MDVTCLHVSEGIPVRIPTDMECDAGCIEGYLKVPEKPLGIVLFAHGSGSSRHSPRNRFVAHAFNERRIATLLIDLFTRDEERRDALTGELRFNTRFLAERLLRVTDWLKQHPLTCTLPLGYFGASTGAGAALLATAMRPAGVQAIVSRGGRPDLAGEALEIVQLPILLIVGSNDQTVLDLNKKALERMRNANARLEVVAGAGHLFEEPGALEAVAALATRWFEQHLRPAHLTEAVVRMRQPAEGPFS
ncbi:MAG: dienelactone hydrolase family protein [Chloroherpetonaceae bacterium]|nr:dienelactone hydrolase family protein [Chthonomonadaceae bacterium]MDW8207671.1 dienelactone hydrolase family protein [Chloroherpetonaceae bacterium]